MNFLELCKRVRQDSGVTGEGPPSVNAQTGILSRIVNWTKRANSELQNGQDWLFLRRVKAAQLIASERSYTPAMLGLEPIRKLTTVFLNGNKLEVVNYSDWLSNLPRFSKGDVGTPQSITLDDAGNVQFYPVPNAPFDVTFIYQRKAIQLKENTDTPAFDEEFHEAIVCKALVFYADYEEDMYRYQRASLEFDRWESLMAHHYLPQIQLVRG